MQYTQNFVAFVDILGFSSYVSKEENAAKTQDLFTFVEKFRFFYNTSPKLDTKVSFFSDSIVITSSNIESIIIAIYIAESYLQKNLGLLFRGGICHGKYYHDNNVTFGPAVVSAYRLEKQAIYSRIIIEKEICSQLQQELFLFRDIDGYVCCNPYAMILDENVAYGPDGPVYPNGNITGLIIASFKRHRDELIQQIQQYKGTPVVDKYLWRIRPFNYTCNLIANMACGEILFERIGYAVSEELKTGLKALAITGSDFDSYLFLTEVIP
ncbi:MAG: hypothetical protein K2M42_02835 [Oscillospiraceae bacterium]|nr:hypothetical protein [Oscillospiraceae bacterium]